MSCLIRYTEERAACTSGRPACSAARRRLRPRPLLDQDWDRVDKSVGRLVSGRCRPLAIEGRGALDCAFVVRLHAVLQFQRRCGVFVLCVLASCV